MPQPTWPIRRRASSAATPSSITIQVAGLGTAVMFSRSASLP